MNDELNHSEMIFWNLTTDLKDIGLPSPSKEDRMYTVRNFIACQQFKPGAVAGRLQNFRSQMTSRSQKKPGDITCSE